MARHARLWLWYLVADEVRGSLGRRRRGATDNAARLQPVRPGIRRSAAICASAPMTMAGTPVEGELVLVDADESPCVGAI